MALTDGIQPEHDIIGRRFPPDTVIGPTVTIHPTARINVTERLHIGAYTIIGEDVEISGRDVEIGQEGWLDRNARIGGGSCFERQSSFRAGHFFHLGYDAMVNTARRVFIGDEVGLGVRTSIYTHGAYLSALDGFPVSFAPVNIGDRVWIPGGIVNPGVTIGNDVVVGTNSLVTSDLPDGCLAGGSPAKIIRAKEYPKPLMGDAWYAFWMRFASDYDFNIRCIIDGVPAIVLGETVFRTGTQVIYGPATPETERFRNQCRRYGIRFYARPVNGEYHVWQ